MKKHFTILCFILSIITISCKTYQPSIDFSKSKERTKPDYSKIENWASHPSKEDHGDRTPDKLPKQKEAHNVDVFFVYPTMYYGDKKEDQWNAPIDDVKFNKKVDESTILFQASAFNQAGNIYAPRYRQAHIYAYWSKDKASAKKAFELAYEDVREAFQYYLEHENKGKPFILASHSQGTNHCEKLIEEFIDGKPLKNKFVAAYLIGMPISKNRFKEIPPCKNGDDTGCFVSWRTMKREHELGDPNLEAVVTNPLSWKITNEYMDNKNNPGSVLRDFNRIYYQLVDAQVHNNVLWATKPKFPGSIFFTRNNFHIADINFYYFSIRENAKQRVGAFWKR